MSGEGWFHVVAVVLVAAQRLPRVHLLATLVARVRSVGREVFPLEMVLSGVLVPHHLPADLADVAAAVVLGQVLVSQQLQRRVVLQRPPASPTWNRWRVQPN